MLPSAEASNMRFAMKHRWLAGRYETEISHGRVLWQTRWACNGIGLLASSIGLAVRNCRFLNIWRVQRQPAAAHKCLIAWPGHSVQLGAGRFAKLANLIFGCDGTTRT